MREQGAKEEREKVEAKKRAKKRTSNMRFHIHLIDRARIFDIVFVIVHWQEL